MVIDRVVAEHKNERHRIYYSRVETVFASDQVISFRLLKCQNGNVERNWVSVLKKESSQTRHKQQARTCVCLFNKHCCRHGRRPSNQDLVAYCTALMRSETPYLSYYLSGDMRMLVMIVNKQETVRLRYDGLC